MKLRILILPLLLLAAAATTTTTVHAFNITRILAKHPEFSTFNQYLTTSHLAADINRRQTITVCVVDDAAMNILLAKHLSIYTIKNVLSLHVLVDYFDNKKLHQIKGSATTSTVFQATGEAEGNSGFVNITNMKGGKVGFNPANVNAKRPMATYVRSVEELPYNISVIQISHILTSPEAEAPTAAPTDVNISSTLVEQGCKAFSDLLTAQGADNTFTQNLETGLTVFCPSDEALNSVAAAYKNLSSENKTSLLLYHGIPVYYPLEKLRSSNGLMNTLATKGKNKFDFRVVHDGDDVELETEVVTAKITGTLVDKDPLAVFRINKVLLPTELFKTAPEAPAPAPAPKSERSRASNEADSPGPAADEEVPADEKKKSDGWRVVGDGGIMALSLSLVLAVLV